MKAYIARRLLFAIPTFIGAVTIIFLLMKVLPGDAAMLILLGEGTGTVDPVKYELLRDKMGLNDSLWVQYWRYFSGLFTLDLGKSLMTDQPVWGEITQRFPYSLMLIILTVGFAMCFSIPIGVMSALKQDTWVDYTLRSMTILGLSVPGFWVGIVLLLLLLSWFHWFPPLAYAPIFVSPGIALQQLVLPALVLSLRSTAISSRMMRSAMLEVMREDFIRTARAKGLGERMVIYYHGLRNAILPVVTIWGMEAIYLFGGSVVIERVFNVPGMGRLLIDSITNRDITMVQGITTLTVMVVLVGNIAVDILYSVIDPRVRFD